MHSCMHACMHAYIHIHTTKDIHIYMYIKYASGPLERPMDLLVVSSSRPAALQVRPRRAAGRPSGALKVEATGHPNGEPRGVLYVGVLVAGVLVFP